MWKKEKYGRRIGTLRYGRLEWALFSNEIQPDHPKSPRFDCRHLAILSSYGPTMYTDRQSEKELKSL